MIIVLEDLDVIKNFLNQKYQINLDRDYGDVQELKNKVFSSFYRDAKKYLSSSSISKHRRIITQCGNNKRKMIKSAVLHLANALYKKQQIK